MKNPLRLGRAAVALTSLVLGLTGAVAFSSAASATTVTGYSNGNDRCASANNPKSFSGNLEFTAESKTVKATVSAAKGYRICTPQDVTLVSYIAPAPTFAVPQYVYDQKTQSVSPDNSTVTWQIAYPACNTQVDLFLGNKVINPLTDKSDRYGDSKLAWKNFGAVNCVQPAVQAIPNCDGTVDLQLSNSGLLATEDGYNVDFEVSYGGTKQTVTVGAKKVTDLLIPAGKGAISVTADTLQPQTFSWARPETCLPATTGKNDCKVVTITVTNPEKNVDVTANVTYNGQTKPVTVAKGQSTDVTFDAAESGEATVEFTSPSDLPKQTVTIVRGDCATTPPTTPTSSAPSETPSSTPSSASASPSDSTPAGSVPSSPAPSTTPVSSSLPITGSAAGTIAGGAVLLLAIGGVLFFLARRRKVNFTA